MSKFGLLIKPTGSICNLACEYCFYLSKEKLYLESHFRMSQQTLLSCIRQLAESESINDITLAWQGGEPTLMGLEFFRDVIKFQQEYKRLGITFQNTLQTNGVLLDDAWCDFFHKHNFLIGLSLDGPQKLHDRYRKDKKTNPTFKRVIRGVDYLKKNRVDFNVLTTVHAANAPYPLEVYHFLRDEVGAQYIQFIPIVEFKKQYWEKKEKVVTDRSVAPKQYGLFLKTVFDEWVSRDVGRVFVQLFDVALEKWVGMPSGLCIFSPTCSTTPVLEHNGDVYTCDHFVEPDNLLGNINKTSIVDLITSDQLEKFSSNKKNSLPQFCKDCDVFFACHGECPKNRVVQTQSSESGINYLCDAYRDFFHYIDEPMSVMAGLLQRGMAPAGIMEWIKKQKLKTAFSRSKRNDPCPCSSGKKYKYCHGKSG